ncbi:MAG: hypothetical protein AABY11_01645, partial [archaeon]
MNRVLFADAFAQRLNTAMEKLSLPSPGVHVLAGTVTQPPSAEKGDVSIAVFRFTPKGENPAAFALKIVGALHADETFETFQAAGPYINGFVQKKTYAHHALTHA